MRYKELGNTGLQISAITIGTWGIGGAGWGDISRSASVDAIRTAIDHGVNAIDTAPIYGFGNPNLPDFGYGCAEEIIREAIVGQRDRLLLVTKCGLNYNRNIGPKSLYKRMTRAEIMEGCEGSLRRPGTDYLDLLFVHWPDDTTPLEEVAEAMQLLKTQGKIRCYGLSNFTQGDTLRADALLHVGAVQPQYSMVSRSSEAFMQAVHRRGIGTMTYYDPESGSFGALGHGITDVDTAQLMPLASGSIMETTVKAVKKGRKGDPGELKGDFSVQRDVGTVTVNSDGGIFGTVADGEFLSGGTPVPVATAQQVKTGRATILATISGSDTAEYQVEIVRLYGADEPTRNMLLRITDPRLLSATGGIVQGMSGSPILQNGRIVGAVTHVLLNDPTRGYGIFIGNMLDMAG